MAHTAVSLAIRAGAARWGLGALFVLCFAGTAAKYLGNEVGVASTVVLALLIPAILSSLPRSSGRLSERRAALLAVLTFVLLVVAFALVYPRADSGAFGNAGTDRDDAADVGARRLLDGEYPYAGRTYAGNPISQLPGSLILAAPFVAIGASAYQNLFWIPVLFLVLRRFLGTTGRALLAGWLTLLLAPTLVRELVTGGDLIANSVSVLVFLLGSIRDRPAHERWVRYGSAVGLGVALSSRANFVLVVPLLLAFVARREGGRRAAALIGTVAVSFAAVTLPFLLHDPSGFTPLKTWNKLGGVGPDAPLARLASVGAAIAAATVLLTAVLAWTLRSSERDDLLVWCAAVQAVFVLAVVSAWAEKGLPFKPLADGYGLMPLILGLPALLLPVWREPQSAHGPSPSLFARS